MTSIELPADSFCVCSASSFSHQLLKNRSRDFKQVLRCSVLFPSWDRKKEKSKIEAGVSLALSRVDERWRNEVPTPDISGSFRMVCVYYTQHLGCPLFTA
ncbi:hypothetical protein CDAR_248561 [Caerostris darwini]|uniref:Uncharacterized protein n=1 Tax=Caerostris darwini TaxID=1538125 RepID=A0AAV4VGC4_9ARAC|nr:hypothetical protein CDAR_248561 [Caerostris darwini]